MSKRFRLSLVNPAEDVPRIIRAYGKACGGDVALVLRPRQGSGVLVHVPRGGPTVLWRAGEVSDAPAGPAEPIDTADAVATLKEAQKHRGRQGPITLRGQWSGYLHCDGEVPVVELKRKLATYATLSIVSRPDEGVWAWRVERHERWFGGSGQDTGEAPVLLEAIEAGLASAIGLLGQVCGQRDSKRRAAFDPRWAERYPVRPAKERADPTERLVKKRSTRKATHTTKASKTGTAPATRSRPAAAKTASKGRSTAVKAAKPKVTEPAKRNRRRRPTSAKIAPPRPASTSNLTDADADKALLDAFQ